MLDTKQQSRLALAVCIGALVVCVSLFWWLCGRSPEIAFLPKYDGAQWVVYPKPPSPKAHYLAEISTEFRRSFTLASVPPKATLLVRALRRFQITINGKPVALESASPPNWKTASVFDMTRLLSTGTNEISVTVFNERGPPALWLSLDAGSFHDGTGADWNASLLGAAWRKAWPADALVPMEEGNSLSGGESTVTSLIKEWPVILFFAFISTVIFFVGGRAIKQYRASGEPRGPLDSPFFAKLALMALAVLWVALFTHNLKPLPKLIGYDNGPHLDYIDYIRTHRTLPLATDGWEMCQPPLYYIISALILTPFQVATKSDSAIEILRMFGLLIGILQFSLVFLTARLLFLKAPGKQFFCLLFAAFLPENLYLANYVTNEFLAATLVTAAIYFCLRLLKSDGQPALLSAATGLCLGGALLTKASAIVAVPFILGTVACWPLLKHRTKLAAWMRTLGIATLITVAVGGGHYLRVWKHFGTPLVHDWDAISGFAWWADNGFHTASSAFGFGECLVRPYYSAFHSFADGVYSTMWGDALYAGEGTKDTRPPWNYGLMATGYLLALVPTAIILIGFATCIVRFIRRPQSGWFMLLGIMFATTAALLYMNLKLPFYCNAKAFYGMIALVPVCAAGAIGCETLCKTGRIVRPVLSILLGVWALTAYSSFWIQQNAASTHAITGMRLCEAGHFSEAFNELSLSQHLDPRELDARRTLAVLLLAQGHPDDARQQVEQVLRENPRDGRSYFVLARILASQGQFESACHDAQRALELEPGLVDCYKNLCVWLVHLGKNDEAVTAAREGLRLDPMNADLHVSLALALMGLRSDESITQAVQAYRHALRFNPHLLIALNNLAWLLATDPDARFRDGKEAVRLAERAYQLTGKNSYLIVSTLAAAYAEAGRYPDAITSAQKAVDLARSAGDEDQAATNQTYLELYRANHPLRQ